MRTQTCFHFARRSADVGNAETNKKALLRCHLTHGDRLKVCIMFYAYTRYRLKSTTSTTSTENCASMERLNFPAFLPNVTLSYRYKHLGMRFESLHSIITTDKIDFFTRSVYLNVEKRGEPNSRKKRFAEWIICLPDV